MKTAIKEYIEQMIPELEGRIHPIFTTDLEGVSIAYSFTPISGGHLKQSQISLKIIGSDYDDCVEMEDKLNELLDMEEDESFVITGGFKFHSGVAGGGTVFNDECQMWEDTVFYILNWRKANVICRGS